MVANGVAVLVDDEDVPLAVHTLYGVVVGQRILAADGVIQVDSSPYESPGVGGGVGFAGPALIPAGAEGEAVVFRLSRNAWSRRPLWPG